MFSRISDRARKVLKEAEAAARERGHSSVGASHVLHGVLTEGQSVAMGLFENLGVDVKRLRMEVERAWSQTGARNDGQGLDRLIALAAEEAGDGPLNHIGTEHLVLAAMREPDAAAKAALAALAVDLSALRRGLDEMMGRSSAGSSTAQALLKQATMLRLMAEELERLAGELET